MYFRDPKSFFLVLLQLILMVSIFSAGQLLPRNFPALILISSGLILGLWAVSALASTGHFSISPDVHPGAKFVTTGPYKTVRHPIYSALIIGSLGLVVNDFSGLRLILLLLLSCLLIYKLRLEEYYLSQFFSEFKNYSQKTKRLFPGIY